MPTKLTLALLAGLCGCSTTATISLVSGGQVEAKIRHSDPDQLFVEAEGGWEVPISRSEISDIDHPGNAAAMIGGLLSAYGAANIAVGVGSCRANEIPAISCSTVFLPELVGISMLAWGLKTWLGSVHAATRSSSSSSGAVPEPPPPARFLRASEGAPQHTHPR